MYLKTVTSKLWKFYTQCSVDGSSDLYNFFLGLGQRHLKDVEGLVAKIEKISEHHLGPRILNQEICHTIDDKNKIFQIRHGKIRLLCFYSHAEQKVIICAAAFIKGTQKTPKNEIEKAKTIKDEYATAVAAGQVFIVPEPDEDEA